MRNPIIVALDVDDPQVAINLIKKLDGEVGGFKIGPRLTLKAGPDFISKIKKSGTIFFDHKFFDIPSTTVASVKAAFDLGADWVTVHALNGSACLKELAALEMELRSKNSNFKIVVVTVLTSFEAKTLPPVWKDESIEKSVSTLAKMAAEQGLSAFVCSPQEIKRLRAKHKDSFIITPGIRLPTDTKDDQKRVMTPGEALKLGASALVMGRPILEAVDPVIAIHRILDTL